MILVGVLRSINTQLPGCKISCFITTCHDRAYFTLRPACTELKFRYNFLSREIDSDIDSTQIYFKQNSGYTGY